MFVFPTRYGTSISTSHGTVSTQKNQAAPKAIPKKCMYQMPPRAKALQRFVYHPSFLPEGLPANEVIVS
jgi:hypothetical protein